MRNHLQLLFVYLLQVSNNSYSTYLMEFNKIRSYRPRSITDNLINITAMPQGFISFILCHDCESLVFVCQFIIRHCSKEIYFQKVFLTGNKHETKYLLDTVLQDSYFPVMGEVELSNNSCDLKTGLLPAEGIKLLSLSLSRSY